MPQTPLGLITPVNVALATLPQVRAGAGEIPILAGSTLAPRSSGIEGQGQAISDIANSPITKSIHTLGQYMLDKFDPDKRAERQARQSLLNMQVKQGAMEMSLAPQKLALEKEKLGQEIQQNRYYNSLLGGKLNLQKDSLDQETQIKTESLKNEQRRLEIEAQKANSEQEKNSILKKSSDIENQIKEMELQTQKSLFPALSSSQESGDADLSELRFSPHPILKAKGQEAYEKKKKVSERSNEVSMDEVKNFNKNRVNYDDALQKLSDLGKLNETGSTGFENRFIPNIVSGDDERNFDAAAINYARSLRKEGEGSMSDKDVELLLQSAPNVGNSKELNKSVIARLRAENILNKSRQDYISKRINQGASVSEARSEFERFAASKSRPEDSGSQEDYVKVATKEEVDKLPSGTIYIGPSGTKAIKP